jgi:RNA-directed DNA polymerase
VIGLRDPKHLCKILHHPVNRILEVTSDPDRFYEEFLLRDPTGRTRDRPVLNVIGELRLYQERLHKYLSRKLPISPYSHDSVKGRSIKTNAEKHCASRFLFKADIANCYPSIKHVQVYRLFTERLECSPDVARLCTRICTYKHHLALGLPTSPILADQLLAGADRRIARLCERHGLVYTRYVDDIFISGPYDLEQSSFARIVQEILQQQGLRSHKHHFGAFGDDASAIAGIRIRRRKIDAKREYIDEVYRQLDDAAAVSMGNELKGLFYTRGQITGRINFVCWLNPKYAGPMHRRLKAINWRRHAEEAEFKSYQVRKRLMPLRQMEHGCPNEGGIDGAHRAGEQASLGINVLDIGPPYPERVEHMLGNAIIMGRQIADQR